MKKRLLIFFTVLTLLTGFVYPVYAEPEVDSYSDVTLVDSAQEDYEMESQPLDEHNRLVDNANLLTEDEKGSILTYLNEISERQQFDIVIVTVNSLDGKSVEAYADDMYDYNGYGFGANHDGCLLLVSMSEREWHITTTGYGITALTDEGQRYISNEFQPYLSDGNYSAAFNSFISNVDEFVSQAKNGKPYDVGNMPRAKKQIKEYFKTFAISLIVALVVAFIIMKSIKSSYTKAVRMKANATDYLVDGSLVVTGSYDNFLYSNVTQTRIDNDSSGGSSTHSGSSGTSHGGSSGHF